MGILRLSRMEAKQIVQMRKDEERVKKNLRISPSLLPGLSTCGTVRDPHL